MTTFIHLLDVAVDEKASALSASVHGKAGRTFDVDPLSLPLVPGSPFAYWISDQTRGLFGQLLPVEAAGRTVKQGLATADDFRFLRAWWEVDERRVGPCWASFAKGGAHSPFYADIPLVIQWADDGAVLKAKVIQEHGNAGKRIYNEQFYRRPGLTWPIKNRFSFKPRVLPRGSLFAHVGPSAFVSGDEALSLLALQAVMSSSAFTALARIQAGWNFEVGVIQRTPVPTLSEASSETLAPLARSGWLLGRSLDTVNETSHAFVLPASLSAKVIGHDRTAIMAELEGILREIDARAFDLYGIASEDRAAIAAGAKRPSVTTDDGATDSDGDEEAEIGDAEVSPISWCVGVAFGRFDERLATGGRAMPAESDPFDALPRRSPGMCPEGEPHNVAPLEILVDDPGHSGDLAAHVASVMARIGCGEPENLRTWLANEFFAQHIKTYSTSRRKAPIYWQIATPSASYSTWLYLHAFTKDTGYKVQNDFAVPKLRHEEGKLESLRKDVGPSPTSSQRKELASQEDFVAELRAFLDEIKRIAPLWNPNLDDGVIINFAPLWRLVPQHRAWQKECKATWDALGTGEYDWAHLAMHLWPERVLPKCRTDRSLAIAHGLEDVFWFEDTDGKWKPRSEPTNDIDALVRERTSPAVKAALKSLMEASTANGAAKSKRAGRKGKSAVRAEGEA